MGYLLDTNDIVEAFCGDDGHKWINFYDVRWCKECGSLEAPDGTVIKPNFGAPPPMTEEERERSERDLREFDRKSDVLNTIGEREGFKHSTWSIYEVAYEMNKPAFVGIWTVVYKNHWGNAPVSTTIADPTWIDMWRVGDKLIRLSGDSHHSFIESFHINADGEIEMNTGS